MIGKITTGKSFKGCLLYCLNDKKQVMEKVPVMEGRAEIILFNQCFGKEQELVAQFNAVRQLNPKLSKPVLHVTLSLAPGEQLTKDKLMEICEHCAKDLGFENNQYVAIHHLDTNHQHLHLVANRIGFDGKTVSDSNSYKKISAYCRKMELKYNLQQVLSPRKFLSQEQRLLPRQDSRKVLIKQHIKECLAVSKTYEQFEGLMKEKKYEIIKARGIAFRDEKKVYVKGSELGYSLQTIQRILEQNKVRQEKSLILQVQRQEKVSHDSQNFNRLASQKQEDSPTRHVSKGLAKAVDHLFRPEKNNEQVPRELTQEKKKKHGLHPH